MAIVVARAQLGDRAALDAVLRTVQEPLFRHIAGILGEEHTAQDVLQDVLIVICRRLGSLKDPRWFRAWAYRIATREAVRRSRSDSLWKEAMGSDHIEQIASPDVEAPFDQELVAGLSAAIDTAPPASQMVLRMHYLDGLTLIEVAEALGISIGTVKSRLAYGLGVLRKTVKRPPR